MGQYGAVVRSDSPGAEIKLGTLAWRGDPDSGGAAAAGGISLVVPPGQSLALLSQPRGAAADLLDVIAGLVRPLSGQVRVDGVAVDRLRGAALDRYHTSRGLVSPRFPLLPSLSVTDNVLAPLLAGRIDAATRERAARLLEFAAGARLSRPVHRLSDEQQWRIMIARALVPAPRLVLAEDPTPSIGAPAATRALDVLMEAHATFGFTLLLAADRLSTAIRCQRQVSLVHGTVVEDEVTSGDDAWTRSRIDRIG
jgi:putative ABC transport system ATP-binding protein